MLSHLLISTIALLPLPALASAVFTAVGHLDGQQNSGATDVSADGSVIIGSVRSGSANQDGFFWNPVTGFDPLLGGEYSQRRAAQLDAISSDGAFVAGRGRIDPDGRLQAFRWSSTTGYQYADSIANSQASYTVDLSGDGQTLVGWTLMNDNSRQAFSWNPTTGTSVLTDDLGNPVIGEARSVSSDGSRIVGYNVPVGGTTQLAFLWTSTEGYRELGFARPGDTLSNAQAISGNGLVIAGITAAFTDRELFHWTEEGGMTVLDLPSGAYEGSVLSINHEGTILAGTTRFGFNDFRATIWDENLSPILLESFLLAQGIDITAWTNTTIQGISDDGHTLVGTGTNPDGNHEGWVVTNFAIPEPSTSLLAVSALSVVILRRRRTLPHRLGLKPSPKQQGESRKPT